MISRTACEVDNRDTEQMYGYLEARIDVLKRRVSELERENQILHDKHRSSMSDRHKQAPVAASQRLAG